MTIIVYTDGEAHEVALDEFIAGVDEMVLDSDDETE